MKFTGAPSSNEFQWLYSETQHQDSPNDGPQGHIDGLMQERRNSIANAMELRLSCTNPSTRSIAYGLNIMTW